MTGMRSATRVGGLVLATVALAGCLDVPVPSASPTAAPTPEPTPVTTTYQLNTTAWYEGLLVHLASATATLDERGGPVELRLRLENQNDEDGELNARVQLQVGDAAPPVTMTRDSKIPEVPAHAIVEAVLTYELQGIASAENAVVLIGEAPNHVARIPLTAAGGAPLALEPVNVTVSGRGDAGSLRITLRRGVLRWDLPDWSQELASNLEAITLTYDVTYRGGFTGGFAFTGGNVALRLPDGTVVDERRDGHSQSIELIGAHQTRTGLFSRFEIPSGTTGKLTFLVRNGKSTDRISFTIPD